MIKEKKRVGMHGFRSEFGTFAGHLNAPGDFSESRFRIRRIVNRTDFTMGRIANILPTEIGQKTFHFRNLLAFL